jgi:hypothetical protein
MLDPHLVGESFQEGFTAPHPDQRFKLRSDKLAKLRLKLGIVDL